MSQYNTALVEQMVSNGVTGSRQLNDELYPLVAAGDKDAIRKMIEANMSLAISKVDSYIGTYPHVSYLREDMEGEGFLGVTMAVNKMAEAGPIENPNPTGYISYWIMERIGYVVDREITSGLTDRGIRKKRAKQQTVAHQVAMPPVLDILMDDPTKLIELREQILSCCETEQDRTIVRMRESRYTDKEIAAALDAPVTTTYMLRRAIYARFLEKSGMKGEV